MSELVVRGLQDDASDGRDADASGEKDGGDAGVVVEGEFAPGSFEGELGAEVDGLQAIV